MNEQKKITAGLVGAGHIAEFHIRALKRLPNVEIIGVADLREDQARALAEAHHLPASFSSLDDLLQQKPQVLHVLTPPAAHTQNTLDALKHGCHVLVEKPLATSVEDCDRIAAAAAEAGKVVCVDHSLLWDPFVQRALQIAASGAICDVVSVDHLRSQHYVPYQGGVLPEQYRDGGFPFRDIGVHSLYLIEKLLGEIQDADLQLGSPENDGCPRFKEWNVMVRCERGVGHVALSWNVNPLQNVLLIHGTRGVIRADLFGMSVTTRKAGRLPEHATRILNTVNEGRSMMMQVTGNVFRVLRKKLRQYHGLQELVIRFYETLDTGDAPPVTIEQARSIIDWTERIATQADREKEAFASRFAQSGTAKILVTGATGFIGSHLLSRLLEEGNRVRLLVRRTPSAEIAGSSQVETFLGDLGNAEDVDRAMQGIEEVYHLGATVEGWAEEFQCATVAGTQNIVDSVLRHEVPKLIYMSSLSVLHAAAARNGKPIAEDWPLEPFPEDRGLYSQTKLAAERIVTEAVETRSLRAIILRPAEVIGPDRPFMSGAAAIEAGSRLVVLGRGKFVLPLVRVEDLVDAIVAAGKSALFDGSIFHIVDPAQVSQNEIARHYLRTTGQDKSIWHFPLSLLYTAAAGASVAARLLGRSAPLTPYRLRSAIGTRHFDCTAAKNALGWAPQVGIRAGME